MERKRMIPAGFLLWLDIAAIFTFGITGALVASRKQLDIVGFMFLATVTGVGGGTLRDLVLDVGPVFWTRDPWYLFVTAAAAILVFFTAHLVESRYRALLWADAVGLALYAVVGARIALDQGAAGEVAVLMGVMTAAFGGLLRDVICNETPLVLRREIYWTAAFLGAVVVVLGQDLGVPAGSAEIAGFLTTFAARAAGLVFDLSLPAYRPRAGRVYPPDARIAEALAAARSAERPE
jgi:uncharacterized membrane protein YeiH